MLKSKHERWNGGGARARARAWACVCGTAADCVCSTPSASLRGRFGKVISGSSGQGLRWNAGGHQHQDLQTNGFTRCDHDLMCCEGGRGGPNARRKWHFPVEREVVDDVTGARGWPGKTAWNRVPFVCRPARPSQPWVATTVFTQSAMKFSTGRNTEVGLRLSRRISE